MLLTDKEMNLMMNVSLILFSFIIACSAVIDFTENDVITYVSRYIENNPRIRVITIYNKVPEKLSSASLRFVRGIINRFPTISVEINELRGSAENQRLLRLKQWLNFRSQRKSLSLLFIDNDHEQNIDRALNDRVTFIADFTVKDTRPQCIFFVVNSARNVNLRGFFNFSWSLNFLDIVLLELVKSAVSSIPFVSSVDRYAVFVHQFNPFNNTYYRKTVLEGATSNIFVKKLDNLYGYSLRTGIFDDVPMVMVERNYSGDDVWGLAQGMDVMITRTLAETMNFTANLNVICTESLNLRRFNISNEYMESALEKESVDFVVNFFGMIVPKSLEDMPFESSIFLYTFSSNLVIKQYGKSVTKLSLNLVIIASVIATTLVAFTLAIRLLGLDTKIWTTSNITKIMVGISISADVRKVYERIIFLTLAAIFAALSFNILEQLLDIYLWRDVFLDLYTLQDVLDAGITPTITHSTKKMISSFNHTALEKVLETSVLMDEEKVPKCIEMLINQRNVNGCEVDSILGKLMARTFSDKGRGWIITFVNEPIVQPCWTAMLFTKTSPFVVRFNHILRSFLESGLVSFWYRSSLKNFTFVHKNFFGVEQLYHDTANMFSKKHLLKSHKISLNKRIILILLIGDATACLTFILELVLGYCKRRVIKRTKVY